MLLRRVEPFRYDAVFHALISRPTKLSALARSETFFSLPAAISRVASITVWVLGAREEALFVVLWVPSTIGWVNLFKLKGLEVNARRKGTLR